MRNGERLLGTINVSLNHNGPMSFTIWRASGFHKFSILYKGGGGTWADFDRLFGVWPKSRYEETYEC